MVNNRSQILPPVGNALRDGIGGSDLHLYVPLGIAVPFINMPVSVNREVSVVPPSDASVLKFPSVIVPTIYKEWEVWRVG